MANTNQMHHISRAFYGVYCLEHGDTEIVGSDPTQAMDDIRVCSMSLLTCVGKDLHMADISCNDFCQVCKTDSVSELNCESKPGQPKRYSEQPMRWTIRDGIPRTGNPPRATLGSTLLPTQNVPQAVSTWVTRPEREADSLQLVLRLMSRVLSIWRDL